MEIKKIIDATFEEVVDFINEMVVLDIENATEETVAIGDVQPGYEYKKQIKGRTGMNAGVRTTIVNLEPGLYRAEFTSFQGVNFLEYKYKATDDGMVEIDYSEGFDAASKSKDLNHKLLTFLFSRSSKKRINLILDRMEFYIQGKRTSAE